MFPAQLGVESVRTELAGNPTAYSLTSLPSAPKLDSKGHTRGAGKVRRRADRQAGRRAEGQRGGGEAGGASAKSETGGFVGGNTHTHHHLTHSHLELI